jgi:DNA adenine methylase
MAIAPVLKYPGAKWKIAKWIISFMPEHEVYLEPFFGSGAVFFNKRPAKLETVNDLDGDVVNLFKVIRDRPEELARLVEFTPWARAEYLQSMGLGGELNRTGNEIEDARRFLVRCWMAFGGNTNRPTGWAHYTSGKFYSSMPNRWKQMPQKITTITKRFKQVQIECQQAAVLIPRYYHQNVLIYADPPYPLSTRSGKLYHCEMTDAEHLELMDILDRHPGPVLLSGFSCELYNDRLQYWKRVTTGAQANCGKATEEVLWLNPIAVGRLRMPLFEASESR